MQELVRWARTFQVWQYTVSHSTLLLRSYDPEYATRIDVVFPAVELMRLQPTYETLAIHRATEQERRAFLNDEADQITHGSLFLLNEGQGFVHSAKCAWHEDNGNHHAPSKFGPLRGTE